MNYYIAYYIGIVGMYIWTLFFNKFQYFQMMVWPLFMGLGAFNQQIIVKTIDKQYPQNLLEMLKFVEKQHLRYISTTQWWNRYYLKHEFRVPTLPWRNGPKASKTRLFFIFLLNFLPYLIIFQSDTQQSCWGTLKNHQICQKMKKILVQLTFNPFFG